MELKLNYDAVELVSTENMDEETWLEYRRKGIGGSDAAAVLGVSPYKTARDVYFEKLGRKPDVEEETGWVAKEVGKSCLPVFMSLLSRRLCLSSSSQPRHTVDTVEGFFKR